MIVNHPPPHVKSIVRYHRPDRHWLCVNGKTTIHESKELALLAALRHDRPDLAAKVNELTRLHPDVPLHQWLKAAARVAKGKVYNNGEVASQTRPDVYHQTSFDGAYHCGCEATVSDPILGKTCAHTLAQHLAYLAGIELPSPPIPFDGEPVVINDDFDFDLIDYDGE